MATQGKLTVVLHAIAPGVRSGPYQIEIIKSGKGSGMPTAKGTSVLGSPSGFNLPPARYKVVVTHPKEGTYTLEARVVAGRETVVNVDLGKPLARGYRKLLLEMRDREPQFEAYMLSLAKDPQLQAAFLADPEQALRATGVLTEGEHLSRSNRLFIGLLVNQDFLKLVRSGPEKISVPDLYRAKHKERLERLAAKVLPANRYISEESIQGVIQQRYYFQRVFESVLTDPVVGRIYDRTIDRDYVHGLIDGLYDFSDDWQLGEGVAPGVVALDMKIEGAGMEGIGMGNWYVFTPASQSADYAFGLGITQTAAIVLDSYIITKTWIFTDAHVLCSLAPSPEIEPGVSDHYEYFEDFTVEPELADQFDLEVFQVNEIFNISQIADAMIVGMDIMDYQGALNAAREHVFLTPH